MICVIFPDKPPIEDLQYFLDFQITRVWAPEQNNLQRKEPVCPSLQFSLMGPKLYVSPDQVWFRKSDLMDYDIKNQVKMGLQHKRMLNLPLNLIRLKANNNFSAIIMRWKKLLLDSPNVSFAN